MAFPIERGLPMSDCRLYLITPPKLKPSAFADALARALDAGDVASVQLRLKGTADDAVRAAAHVLRPVAQSRDVAFIINDRPDLALETDCDGVHIGQEDATYEEARQALGADRIVGVTCHDSRDLCIEAAEKGADYVAFGAFFPTTTKRPKTRAGTDILQWWSDLTTVPSVAIGGITPKNCLPLVRAGANFLAVSSAVWDFSGGPAAAVEAFAKVLEDA